LIEFLSQMPTDEMIFLAMAVLGLAALLIALRRMVLRDWCLGIGSERLGD